MARILLIDDQRIHLDRAQALLCRDGHDLIEATDALAGLHRAVEDTPACIVVDLDLAGLDGLEICRQLARSEATARIPVVVWGASGAAQAGPLAREAGAFAYVDRVRTPSALSGSVWRALVEGRREPAPRRPFTRPRPGSVRA